MVGAIVFLFVRSRSLTPSGNSPPASYAAAERSSTSYHLHRVASSPLRHATVVISRFGFLITTRKNDNTKGDK